MWKRGAINGARLAWFTLCITALIAALKRYSGSSDWQTEEALFLEMMALSFPSSVGVCLGITGAGALLGLFGTTLPMPSRTEMVCFFVLFVAAGYVQWFIIFPRLFKLKSKRLNTLADNSRS
jgi:hypothetical protein